MPLPKVEYGVGTLALKDGKPSLAKAKNAKNQDRFHVLGNVWNEKFTGLETEIIGYVVINDIEDEKGKGYTYIFDDSYSYSYSNDEILTMVKAEDKDAERWVGNVWHVGKKAASYNPFGKPQEIEIKTDIINKDNSDVYAKKTYDIVLNDMGEDLPYNSRIIAKAQLSSVKKKVIFKIVSYVENYNLTELEKGLDVYISPEDM